MNKKFIHNFAITTFVALYFIVSFFSTFHVVAFFALSNPMWVSIGLAIAFEVGAAASLAALTILDKLSKNLVLSLFILLTLMQMMGNMYYTYIHLGDISAWSEMFFLSGETILLQKQILSLVSGGILPLIALGFIKSLVDYIKPSKDEEKEPEELIDNIKEAPVQETPVQETPVQETPVQEAHPHNIAGVRT